MDSDIEIFANSIDPDVIPQNGILSRYVLFATINTPMVMVGGGGGGLIENGKNTSYTFMHDSGPFPLTLVLVNLYQPYQL